MALVLSVFILLFAVLLDSKLGEPKRFHPLVGYGRWVSWIEKTLNPLENHSKTRSDRTRIIGLLAWCIAVLPLTVLLALFIAKLPTTLYVVVSIVVLYLTIGHKSLRDHVLPIATALNRGDESEARRLTSMIVSRDPEHMDIEKSAVESALENGSDSIFAPVFWFMVAGPVGAFAYRLANTLDAMWGYKMDRYLSFGWASAKIDDVLNYVPARLTAVSYLLMAGFSKKSVSKTERSESFNEIKPFNEIRNGWACWQTQAKLLSSPNGGPVMTAGAGALGVKLGGPTCYHGEWLDKPEFGCGDTPNANDIKRSIRLVTHTLWLWVTVPFTIVLVAVFFGWSV